jgi:hypothetical protein
MKLNLPAIPNFADYWSRSNGIAGTGIAFFSGGIKAVGDKSFPSHQGQFINWHGSLFGLEETMHGLDDESLSQYEKDDERIVASYYWHGWDDEAIRRVYMAEMAQIMAEHGGRQRYGFQENWTYVPGLKWVFPKAWTLQSKNCSSFRSYIMIQYGCTWLGDWKLRPDETLARFQWARKNVTDPKQKVTCVLNYYQ